MLDMDTMWFLLARNSNYFDARNGSYMLEMGTMCFMNARNVMHIMVVH